MVAVEHGHPEPLRTRPSVASGKGQGRRSGRGSGLEHAKRVEGRSPVAAALAVVFLLGAGWPVADVVGGMAPRVGSAGASAPVVPVAAPPPPASGERTHVVQPGETYWSIAEGLGAAGDIRSAVDALVAANDGLSLHAGDRLRLPPLAR